MDQMNLVDIIIIIAAVFLVAMAVRSVLGAAKHGECASCRRRNGSCGCCKSSDDLHCNKCKK